MTTFYDILGVQPTASANDIKVAYRQLAMQFHPDKTPNANQAVQRLIEDKFKEVQEAYDTLKDRAKRVEYDAALAMLSSEEYYQPPPPPPPPPPPQNRESCPKCHKFFPSSATSADRFCTYCGASLQSSPPPSKQKQHQPPPQTLSSRQKIHLMFAVGLGGLLIWAGIAAAIRGMFPTVTDDAARSSAFFFIASPIVLWICVMKAKMKWPMPALLPPLTLLLIAVGIQLGLLLPIGAGEKEILQHPPNLVKAVQQQTSQVEAGQSPRAAIQQPRKPLPQPQTKVLPARPKGSPGIMHTPMAIPPNRLDPRQASVGEPQSPERSELQGTTPTAVSANNASNANRPSTVPQPDFNVSSGEITPPEALCSQVKALEGLPAYNRCLEDQLSRLASAPRRPELSST